MPSRRDALSAFAALAAAGLGLGLGGCDEAPAPSRTTKADKQAVPDRKLRIALVMKTLTNPFFAEMESGARHAEAEFDVELLVRTAAQETSIEQQIAIVEELIASRVDAIVIAPGDSFKLIPVLAKARKAGIVVINIDNRLDPGLARQEGLGMPSFIGVDNRIGAYRAVKILAEPVTVPTEAAVIEGIRSAANAEARKRGALQAFAENPLITVVAQETASWKIDEAHDVARKVLAAHPGVKLIFCANDMMALGVLRFLRDQQRSDIRVAGFDALPEVMPALRAGQLTVTVDQRAAEQGQRGVQAAIAAVKGAVLPPEIMIDVAIVTAASLRS